MSILTHILAVMSDACFGAAMMAVFAAGGRADEADGIK